ncbi:MAG: hypothetical protein MUO97_02730 [Dehalococcoidia bacterium]|nr:hypothetical protein [Dehalococcoidia bacterium]
MAEQPRVAIYALCEHGDRGSLILAQNVCRQNGWVQPLEYVDKSKVENYDWKHLLADIALGDYKQILVTYFASPELEQYCAQYNCTLIPARV